MNTTNSTSGVFPPINEDKNSGSNDFYTALAVLLSFLFVLGIYFHCSRRNTKLFKCFKKNEETKKDIEQW